MTAISLDGGLGDDALLWVFDIDGTVLDTFHPQYEWLKYAAERFGGRFPFAQFDDQFRGTYNRTYHDKGMIGLYDMIGVDFHTHQKDIWKEYLAFNNNHPIHPIAGVKEAILEMARIVPGERICTNTTKRRDTFEGILEREGLKKILLTPNSVARDDLYNLAKSSIPQGTIPDDEYKRKLEEEVKRIEKPSTTASVILLKKTGIYPDGIVAFEDSVAGVRSYKRVPHLGSSVDIRVVGVTWGYDLREDLEKAGADIIIDHPEDIAGLAEEG